MWVSHINKQGFNHPGVNMIDCLFGDGSRLRHQLNRRLSMFLDSHPTPIPNESTLAISRPCPGRAADGFGHRLARGGFQGSALGLPPEPGPRSRPRPATAPQKLRGFLLGDAARKTKWGEAPVDFRGVAQNSGVLAGLPGYLVAFQGTS